MRRYHIYFSSTHEFSGQAREHTRVIELEHPIEYDSDIVLVQKLAATLVDGAKDTMLTSWRELKGAQRPARRRLEIPPAI